MFQTLVIAKKMKNTSLFFIALSSCINTHAQFGPQQIISTDAGLAESVFSIDIDGDGDMDVLSASRGDDKIAWYENLDGLGNFGPQQIIASLDQTQWVRAADLDGDDDIDVLALASFSNLIVWYENLDGLGTFSSQKIISTDVDFPSEVIAADINGDGDMDVLSASRFDNKIAWYENLDGLGNFGPQQIISASAITAISVYAADIDGDLDLDVMGTSGGNKRLYWYENLDGLGSFGPGQIIVETANFGGFVSIFSIDVDGDDDMDVLSAEFGGNRIAWYENTDGNGSFGPLQVIDANLIKPLVIYSVDLDNDGDNDVLAPSAPSALENDSLIVWYENTDGQGNFGPPQIIIETLVFAKSVFATDIDNDGDTDVLSASQNDNTIAWYENLTILGVDENALTDISINPNPVKNIVQIQISDSIEIKSIAVFDVLGKQLFYREGIIKQLDVSSLHSGVLFMQVETDQGIFVKKIIKK
jgi:hypothetical protein